MALPDIPVVDGNGGLTGNAAAVLGEVEALLDGLLRTAEGGMIDIRGLPLSAADRRWLQAQLGEGEVEVRLSIAGASRILETAYPGVWWIEHRDERDNLVSEFIQVAYVPELISAHPDDVEGGLDLLRSRIAELS
ncbi:MAG: hydrogenase expression/formation C-terminal domain-containing protein [Gallionellaceae bacterium]|nr:hydrogenase expression/formation C-terminal domain-containing protein [Gallionellaceae bacterium]